MGAFVTNSMDFTVAPLIQCCEFNTEKLVISGKYEHNRALLKRAKKARFMFCESSTYDGWQKDQIVEIPLEHSDEDSVVFRNLSFPDEGEYLLMLDEVKDDGTTREILTFAVYAVKQDIIGLRPYKGDFHMHSNNSDGTQCPEFMGAACRSVGMDFMALTDHGRYAPSVALIESFKRYPLDMKLFPGEEVHLKGNWPHIINFGGNTSVNDQCWLREADFDKEMAERLKNYDLDMNEPDTWQIAVSEWAYDKIREAGGIAMFCHPYWRWHQHNYISGAVVDKMLERHHFDVLELFGGFYEPDYESNMLMVARYNSLCASGINVPVAGISDCHNYERLLGWFYTIVFAPSDDFSDLAAGIRGYRSVAVHRLPKDTTEIVLGDYRFARYTYFLLRNFYPLHNALCRREADLIFADMDGSVPNAVDQLHKLQGEVPHLFQTLWAVPKGH